MTRDELHTFARVLRRPPRKAVDDAGDVIVFMGLLHFTQWCVQGADSYEAVRVSGDAGSMSYKEKEDPLETTTPRPV